MLSVLIYIDDILVYSKTEEGLVSAIEQVLMHLEKFGIKLKPAKCDLFCVALVWCGHHISSNGIGVDPRYTEAVINMLKPTTAADLQQFLGSCSWVRGKLPVNYAKVTGPLHELLNVALKGARRRNKRTAAKVKLADIGWKDEHDRAYATVKQALADAITLAHADDGKVFCLFPDASELFWASVLTQVPKEDADSTIPYGEWDHEPLAVLSGAFKGHSKGWGIPDKEGFAVKESCAKLAHFLAHRGGFRIFTDHRNLRYIFNPRGVVSQISKPQADRLERWAVFLRGFDYSIDHIEGEHNLFADMLLRWAAGSPEAVQSREQAKAVRRRWQRLAAAAHESGEGSSEDGQPH